MRVWMRVVVATSVMATAALGGASDADATGPSTSLSSCGGVTTGTLMRNASPTSRLGCRLAMRPAWLVLVAHPRELPQSAEMVTTHIAPITLAPARDTVACGSGWLAEPKIVVTGFDVNPGCTSAQGIPASTLVLS